MDVSPIHLTCERWTSTLIRHFSPTIHAYFDHLYNDAIDIAKNKKIRDITFTEGLFQKWCREIEDSWTPKELRVEISIIRSKYKDLETLISNVLSSNLMIMSVMRHASVQHLPQPVTDVERFVHLCYWLCARDVAFPYPPLFNPNLDELERCKCHRQARELIEGRIKDSIVDYLQPILDKLSEHKKKKKHRRKSPMHNIRQRDIGELTEQNLRKFAETNDHEAKRRLEEFEATRSAHVYQDASNDNVYPDDSASAVYMRPKQNVLKVKTKKIDVITGKSVSEDYLPRENYQPKEDYQPRETPVHILQAGNLMKSINDEIPVVREQKVIQKLVSPPRQLSHKQEVELHQSPARETIEKTPVFMHRQDDTNYKELQFKQPSLNQARQPSLKQPSMHQPTLKQPSIRSTQPMAQPSLRNGEMNIRLTEESGVLPSPITSKQPSVILRKGDMDIRLEQPSLKQPSLKQPSLKQPSLKQPSLNQPPQKQPSLKQPSLKQPSLKQPPQKQPSLKPDMFQSQNEQSDTDSDDLQLSGDQLIDNDIGSTLSDDSFFDAESDMF